jgi:5-methylcytosine-specific restriction endonuclease McrA
MTRIAGAGVRRAITAKMKLDVLNQIGVRPPCHVCKQPWFMGNLHFDHVQALVDGGAHSVENIRPICVECHKKKSAFEHTRNSKGKRLAAARQIHEAAKRGEYIRPQSRLKGKGFDKSLSKKFSGEVVRRG